MDTMELIGGEDLDYGPALEDVDMDLLVGASFNKVGSRNAPSDVEPRQTPEEDLDGETGLIQAHSFLSMDLLGDLSPRNISDGREIPLEKHSHIPFLVDHRELHVPHRVQNETLPQTVVLTDSATPSPGPLGAHPLSLGQATALPETTLNDELASFTQHPFTSQNEWQDVTTIALSTSPQSVPSGVTNPVKMLQLDPQLQSLPQPLQGTELDLERSPQFINNEGRSLKVQCVSMKPPRRKSERSKEAINRRGRVTQGTGAENPSSGKGPKKKAGGRRKAGANAHLSLEERKKLRAERNRESAEKSRMRRKQMIVELETNVAFLREENRDLKAKVEQYHGRLTSASEEVSRRSASAGDGSKQDAMLRVPALYEALSALQRCMQECPRTFNRNPNTPVIPLNVPRPHRR